MAGWFVDRELPAMRLWGMWVAPPARGRGAGRALAETVVGRARDRGLERLTLAVSDAAAAAERAVRAASASRARARRARWSPTPR